MPDTGAPWNITYVAGSDLVADWPADNQTMAESVAAALDVARTIVQVVYANTSASAATTGTSYVDTSLTASITPVDDSNQVLVIANFEYLTCNNSTSSAQVRIWDGSAGSGVTATRSGTGTDPGHNITYIDSPASAAAVTYTAQIRRTGGGATATVSGNQTLLLVELAA